jgi:hypothetical protein
MAQMTFSVPNEVRRAVLKLRQVDWDDLVSHLLWEYTKRLQLVQRLTRHSRLTAADVADLDTKVKATLAKRYRVS